MWEWDERAFWDSIVEIMVKQQLRAMQRFKETKDPKYLDDVEFYREHAELFKSPSAYERRGIPPEPTAKENGGTETEVA